MKPKWLARKSHSRASVPGDNTIVFDLTEREGVSSPCSMAGLRNGLILTPDQPEAAAYEFRLQKDILEWCAAIVMESPSAGSLWLAAERDGWSLAFDDLKNGGFLIDARAKHIVLDHFALSPAALGRSAWFRNALLVTLIRALRDVWHESRSEEEGIYVPEDALMLERLRAADEDTFAVLAGWELRGAGFGEVWRHMIGAPEGDLALVFARHLERDPAALFDGSAPAYAFRQWFADEARVNGVDHQTLEMLDDAVMDGVGAMRLDENAIETLSALPGGIVYLKGLGHAVRNDPFFAGLHDPINQTHLFHLVYDAGAVLVNNVPFRDRRLARLIFPDSEIQSDF